MAAAVIARRTAAVSSVGTTWAAFATDWDLVVPATAGDVLELGVSVSWGAGATFAWLDMATMVSGSPVNWVSTGTGSHTNGPIGWFSTNTFETHEAAGTVIYTVQSGDVSGGNVTFRLYGKVSASTRPLNSGWNQAIWAASCSASPVSSSLTGTVTGSWAALSGSVTVAATAGDVLAVTIEGVLDPGSATAVRFDAATMVSGSPVNWVSTGTGSHTDGCLGWRCFRNNYEPVKGTVIYTVQSGDVSGGNVTFQIWAIGGARPMDVMSKFRVRKV